jgi:phosphoribosylformimino-5-aminoimidazole carboxamide ribotide isomerase
VTIVPAIDLRAGRCVRLLYGDPTRETRYDGDPVERAREFTRAGATRLHVVDLDGAFGTGENLAALRAICAAVDVPVQTGGGIRSALDARTRFEAGAAFVILGTLLACAPEVAREIVAGFGPRAIAGVDARGSAVAVRGWQSEAPLERDAFVRELARAGFERIVFTEIAPLRITASGGAKTLDDLRALASGTPPNVDQAIVGRAFYEGTLDVREAIAALASV